MGAESTAGRKPNIGFINEPFRQRHRVFFAFNPEIEVKSTAWAGKKSPSGCSKSIAHDVAPGLGARDLVLNKALAMVKSSNAGSLHEGGDP